MKFAGFVLALTGIFAGSALAQAPTVGGLLNNYSFILPGLPNYGIAQGSIFDVFGTNLSSTTTPLQNAPLKSTLDGVTINVTVNGTTTNPLIYFLSPTQIAAVLPSSTPVGTGTLTVSNSAGTSTAFPILVVQSAFGLLTLNNGTGPVAGFDASNQHAMMSYSAAANAGDILELWGTGLGPVTGDATAVGVSAQVEVDIGGVPAKVQYAGRSSYVGLDQINVMVPPGVSGCNVSVVIVTGNYVSNFGTLAVAETGRTCSDATTPVTTAIYDDIAKKGTFTVGFIEITKTTSPGITVAGVTVGGGTNDFGSATFSRMTASQLNSGAYAALTGRTASIGSCNIYTFNTSSSSTTPPSLKVTATPLNAGPDVNIVGPDGTIAMPLQSSANADTYLTGSSNTSFIPASGGTFTFNNGSGGPDVGAFTSAQLQVPAPLVWTNMNAITTVTRSAGVTVQWTGGDPGTYATITGYSIGSLNGSSSQFVGGAFTCLAPVPAGQFTVPSAVLLSLPASYALSEGGVGFALGSLSVGNYVKPVALNAPGIDYGYVSAGFVDTNTVTYQ
jgi:uncharacterized protein (TIGR03437 family)